jgi:hypothetical protein
MRSCMCECVSLGMCVSEWGGIGWGVLKPPLAQMPPRWGICVSLRAQWGSPGRSHFNALTTLAQGLW